MVRAMMRRPVSRVVRYGLAAALVVAANGTTQLLPPTLGSLQWFLPFIVAVALSSWLGGFGPGLLATFGAAWLAGDTMLQPSHWLGFAGAGDVLSMVLFLGLCLLIDLVCSANRGSG